MIKDNQRISGGTVAGKKPAPQKENKSQKLQRRLRAIKTYISSLMITTVSVIAIALFFMYGPVSYFRDLYITSAMTTLNHKWLATTFFSNKTIIATLANNVVLEPIASTDTGKIKTADYTKLPDSDPFKQDYKNQLYKVIDISGGLYKGYMVAIYDPSRISLGISAKIGSSGEKLTVAAKREKAAVAINASGFVDIEGHGDGGTPTGIIIKDGKIESDDKPDGTHNIIGFDKKGVLILDKLTGKQALSRGIVHGVEFGPFLIVNGEPAIAKGNGGWGTAPRTAVGQRKDGIVMFLVIDGRQTHSVGATLVEVIDVMKKYGAYNAANLDGGSSTTLAIEGELHNSPSTPIGQRYLPNWFMVK